MLSDDAIVKFVTSKEWIQNSPDLNPLDYRLWSEPKTVYKNHTEQFQSLKLLPQITEN
jgi:hypothetical protein